MPAPIISGVIKFIQDNLELKVWDGEIPRRDELNVPITLDSGPVFKVVMPEGQGFEIGWTFENLMTEEGTLTIYVMATSRNTCESNLQSIFELFAPEASWPEIDLGTVGKVFEFLTERWACTMVEGARTRNSEFIYLGELHYKVKINSSVGTK